MPFVLGDEGLNYEKTADKEILGKNYQGIKITFDSGIGNSSSDEYFYTTILQPIKWLGSPIKQLLARIKT